MGPLGFTESEQLHVKSSSEHNRLLNIAAPHAACAGRGLGTTLGDELVGTSGLAELEQLQVESNGECSEHIFTA